MSKASEVFKKIRFAKIEKRGKPHLSTDDEEHGAVGEVEWNQQLDHQKKRAMQEEQQLDEISKKTLGSYVSKAASSLSQASASSSHKRTKASVDYDDNIRRGMKKKDADAHLNRGYDSAKPDIQKVLNRVQGIKKAASRLSKEEVECNQQLDHQNKRAMQEKVDKPTGELKDACWKGYTAVGMKEKNGKKVPNCVPTNEGTDMKSARIIKDLYKKKGVSDQDKWKEEYKKARAAGSSSSNAKARANGAVYEEQQVDEGAFKSIATDREEDARLAKSKSWKKETPWMKVKNVVTDKSGAKHGPMSRARDLARKAAIVKEAADKAKAKKKEKKVSDDTYQAEPELSSQIIRND